MPLLFQPGSEWNYSVATDVLGRLLEVIAGKPLPEVLQERVLGPLGMHDTAFSAAAADHGRLAALYPPDPSTGRATRNDALGAVALKPPDAPSGGGGLVSTAADYGRFTAMLLNGGELDGTRILGPRTLDYMTENHLPGGGDLETVGRPLFAEVTFDGVGFGLGFATVLDPVGNRVLSSPGEFNWGGAASTAFFVDPLERLTAMLFTQLLPSSTHPLRSQLRQLTYQALTD
jgi:CubicO group peptidase (beta-lactamase class C family)